MYKFLYGHMLIFLFGKYLGVELLNYLIHVYLFKKLPGLGVVAHAYNPSTLGGQGGQIS